MALETGTYISDLNVANPAGTDARSQGDDHLRLIKSVLKNTFPNLNGAVSATDEQLSAVAAAGTLCFPGMIVMWSGSVASVPSGWKLCNGVGTISTGGAVPNLASRFIVGSTTNSGGTFDVGDTGGTSTHTHTVGVNGTSLTIAQIPAHTHTVPVNTNSSGGYAFVDGSDPDSGDSGTIATSSQGSGQPHTHTTTVATANHLPPYYALAFLIKN